MRPAYEASVITHMSQGGKEASIYTYSHCRLQGIYEYMFL